MLYAEGVRITEHDANWNADTVVLGDPRQNRARIQEAVKVARQADAIVLVIGTNESVSREAWADNHLGDVADLTLMSNQEDLVRGDARIPASRSSRSWSTDVRWRYRSSPSVCPQSSRRGTRGRKAARQSARCCSAT